jgi:Na+/melibiose symporter-like transporter
MCAGALMLVGLNAGTPLVWVLASYVVFGMGFGLVNAPITNTAVSGMPRSQAGVAAAVASTSRQVGTALGVAVVGSVLSSGLAGPLKTGFTAASHPAWSIVAVCGLAVFGIGALTSGRWAVGTAARTAHLFDDGP